MLTGVHRWIADRIAGRMYYGWAVVGVVLSSNLAAFALGGVFGLFVNPLEQEFGWSRADIAFSLTLGTVLGAAMAPGLGYLADRIGTRLLTVVFGIVAGVGYLALGTVQQVWQFNLLVGAVQALMQMGVGQMMSTINVNRWFNRRRGRAMGIVMMGASAGSVLFIPLSTWLIAEAGWRSAFSVMGLAAVALIAVPALLLLVNAPEELGLGEHAELRGAARPPAASGVGQPGASADGDAWTPRQAAGTRAFWFILLGLMVGTVGVQGYFVHAIPHMEAQGFSRGLASAVWSAFFMTGVLSKFLWGFVIERIGVRAALVFLFTAEAAGMYLLLTARSPGALFFYAVANGLGHGPYLQLQAMVWADYFGRRSIGRIFGVVQPAIVVSGSLGPWVGGYLFDIAGNYTLFFHLAMGLSLLAALLFLMTPPPQRRAGGPSGPTAGTAEGVTA